MAMLGCNNRSRAAGNGPWTETGSVCPVHVQNFSGCGARGIRTILASGEEHDKVHDCRVRDAQEYARLPEGPRCQRLVPVVQLHRRKST